MPETCDISIHLASGATVKTTIAQDELDDEQTFEDLIDEQLTSPDRPHWANLGGVTFYTQAISAVEIDGQKGHEG